MRIYTLECDDDPYCAPYLDKIFWALPDALRALHDTQKDVNPCLTEWSTNTAGGFSRLRHTTDGTKWIKNESDKRGG